MILFLTLLPLYLLGNLHCASMCGPLVMLLSRHPFRWFYFLGRITAFSLAGLLSAEIGSLVITHSHFSALFSMCCGLGIMCMSLLLFFRFDYPGKSWLKHKLVKLSSPLHTLLSVENRYATFLFGFCTLLLPCGQSALVFSACALDGNPLAGLGNGFAFALLTSPALVAALYASSFFKKVKLAHHVLIASATLLIGSLTCLRGVAEMGWIAHVVLNEKMHLVLF